MKKLKEFLNDYWMYILISIIAGCIITYGIRTGAFNSWKAVTVTQTYKPVTSSSYKIDGAAWYYDNIVNQEMWEIKIEKEDEYKIKIFWNYIDVLKECEKKNYIIGRFESTEYYLQDGKIYEKIEIHTEDKTMISDDKRLKIILETTPVYQEGRVYYDSSTGSLRLLPDTMHVPDSLHEINSSNSSHNVIKK